MGNAFFGFCSIVAASGGDLVAAAYFIFLGALMDSLDGRIARFADLTSLLGLELDSLCDGVTFCLAPAFLMYQWQLRVLGTIGFLVCAFFLLMGLMRLAYFNITHKEQSEFFTGMPTPIAACLLVALFFSRKNCAYSFYFLMFILFLILLLSILMVSKFPFPTFKFVSRGWYAVAFSVFIASLITFSFINVILLFFAVYFVISFEEFIRRKWFRVNLS
jgi:CDP-diacylglycerol--serine O-phosphatidyltransferase